MPSMIQRDRELVEQIFDGNAENTHKTSERFADDIKDALRVILDRFDVMHTEYEVIYEAERHIEKLEGMLDRRGARYKKWEDD